MPEFPDHPSKNGNPRLFGSKKALGQTTSILMTILIDGSTKRGIGPTACVAIRFEEFTESLQGRHCAFIATDKQRSESGNTA